MKNKWENKQILDTFVRNNLIELYTAIAGITRGYISVVQRDFGYAKKQAEQEILKIDAEAREKVAEAYKIYDTSKGDDK